MVRPNPGSGPNRRGSCPAEPALNVAGMVHRRICEPNVALDSDLEKLWSWRLETTPGRGAETVREFSPCLATFSEGTTIEPLARCIKSITISVLRTMLWVWNAK